METTNTIKKGTVIYVQGETLGRGEGELGKTLMESFFRTLAAGAEKPEAVIFASSGVKLATEGSGLIPVLKELEANGVAIYSCITCLNYYGLAERLAVGQVGNMAGSVGYFLNAEKVISL